MRWSEMAETAAVLGAVIVGIPAICGWVGYRWGRWARPGPEREPFGAEQSFEMPGSEGRNTE